MEQQIIINNRYKLVKFLAEGGFGETHLALDLYANKQVVIKLGRGLKETTFKIFQKEYARLVELDHPYIIKPLHFDIWDTGTVRRPFLIMRYAERGSLENFIGKLPRELLWSMIYQVSDALSYLHSRGIYHNDLRTSNILVDREMNFYITDF